MSIHTEPTLFDLPTPLMEVLDASRCKCKPINHQTAAYIAKVYHYAHRVPSIVAAFGMYVDNVLAGIITYGIPANPNVQRCCGEEYRKNTIELNRLYAHDWAGKNSESWLIGQSFKWLRKMYPEYFIVVSYADTAEGHIGKVYQATNWLYTGIGGIEACAGVCLTDGRIIHSKHLVNMFGTRSLKTIQENLGDSFKEIIPGKAKHRYVYFLGDKSQRRKLRKLLRWPVLPYPKSDSCFPLSS